jgi:LysM repeat protein
MRLRIVPPENESVDNVDPARSDPQTDSTPPSSVAEEGQAPAVLDAPSAEIGTVTPLGGGMVAVTIGRGETLYALANRFALSADSLAVLNPGLPSALESGMVVIVPEDRISRTRTVKPGDTLFHIAREEGVSLARLRALNGISGSSLRIGQELTVPSASVNSSGAINLPDAGQFSIRPYPEALSGRTVSIGRTYRHDAFQIGHPSLPAGSVVLVSTATGSHAFAEVIETAPARRPFFIEGSRKLFEVLSLNAGDRVILHRVR